MVTARGGLRLTLPPGVRALAYETPAGPHDHWNHTVALCLPRADATRAWRDTITELGPDDGSLRPADRAAVLFDLGMSTSTVDACVRSTDPALIDTLRAAEGTALFADPALVAAIVAGNPHRVFVTACGRVEVYAAIPPPGGRSPDGPHTHLLPQLLRAGRTHAATVPVPSGFLPCASFYPAHPLASVGGVPRRFDPEPFGAFQELLDRFGDPGQAALKASTWTAIRTGNALPTPTDPPGRAAVQVALRQIAHLDGHSPALAAARRRHHPDPVLLDPDGDPNG